MTTTADPEYISIRQAAALCGVTDKTIRRYIAAGYLTAYRMGPALLRINRAELLEHFRANRVPAARQAR